MGLWSFRLPATVELLATTYIQFEGDGTDLLWMVVGWDGIDTGKIQYV